MVNLLFILVIIIKISCQKDFCDINTYCNNCSFCNYLNICSCNFYNSFCLNEISDLNYSKEFLKDYDYHGCHSNDGEEKNICGESNVVLNNGEEKTLNMISTSIPESLLCYYRIDRKERNDNEIKIIIQNNNKLIQPEFFFFLLVYDNNNQLKGQNKYEIMNDTLEIKETNCSKISIYLYKQN